MIDMQVRNQHQIDVGRADSSRLEALKIGRMQLVEDRVQGPVLVVA
jgi:hypothetical protein